MDEKNSGQPRGPVVNGATLALFCGITNRAMRSHFGSKKSIVSSIIPYVYLHIMLYGKSL